MDVRMPGMNGIEATRRISREFPETRVLVLTTFDLDEYAVSAVRAGASGFLLKDARPAELVEAIRRVDAGDAAMSPSVTRRLVEQLRGAGAEADTARNPAVTDNLGIVSGADGASRPPVLAALTERELEVLRHIAQGLNNSEIGAELFLSESTVKTHVGRVLSKLHLRDRVHAVILAKGVGL